MNEIRGQGMQFHRERLSEFIELIEGDCLDVLPTLRAGEFDACIVDPPFGTDVPRDGYGRRQLWHATRRIEGDSDLTVMRDAFGELPRLLSPESWVACFASPKRHLEAASIVAESESGLNIRGEVVWDKAQPGLGGGIRYQHELILLASKGTPQGGCELFSVVRVCRVQEAVHPHEKPLGLMTKLIRYCSSPADTILDFAAGSGTTGIAAAMEGRHCLLIEKSPEYCSVIRDRVARYEGMGKGSFLALPAASDLFAEAVA